MRPAGWKRVRAVRLRALRDAPDAFLSTFESEKDRPESWWRERLAAPASAATFLASADAGDVGMVFGAASRGSDEVAGLFGLWVEPSARQRGAATALVRAVVAWARSAGFDRIVLEVADENHGAIRLYDREGFTPTGSHSSFPAPRSHITEHERALRL